MLRQAIKDVGYEPLEVVEAQAGMDREQEARAAEIRTLKSKFVVSLVLSLPIFLGSVGAFLLWVPSWLQSPYVLLLLATPV